jgi:endonuclease/exonuclease/phosphatase family metal-dependent hydrolase
MQNDNGNGLRLGTYNTQMRSTIGEAANDGTLFPNNDAPKRAKKLALAILNSEFDYDIIALNEVFDEDARANLVEALRDKYPHFIQKLDDSLVSIIRGKIKFKLEDSGLMLFSKFPFEDVPTQPGRKFAFTVFQESAEADDLAAKGAAYVRIRHSFSDRKAYNIVFTHMQADQKTKHPKIRNNQLSQIENLLKTAMTPDQLQMEDIFVMGDLNIIGNSGEWKSQFDKNSSFFTSVLHDSWIKDQSPADVDEPDPGLTTTTDRLDYFLHSHKPPMRLQLQHMTLAYNLIPPNVARSSDHFGLNVDLNHKIDSTEAISHCNPRVAKVADLSPTDSTFAHTDSLEPQGAMKWYRFNEPGTYTFNLNGVSDKDVQFLVYSSSDLTTPISPYKKETGIDDGSKFVLPKAPFFVRVFHPDRKKVITSYTFAARKHTGRSQDDAIVLIPHQPQKFTMPKGTPLNQEDIMWFKLHTERADSGLPQNLQFFVDEFKLDKNNNPVFGFKLLNKTDKDLDGIGGAIPQPDKVQINLQEVEASEKFLVVIRENAPNFDVTDFRVGWETNLTILHGIHGGLPAEKPLILECIDETNPEIGSDSIEVQVEVDGKPFQTISNDKIGNFNDGDFAVLEFFFLPKGMIFYVDKVAFKVIEGDTVSSDDQGTIVIPNLERDTDEKKHSFEVSFDGGTYRILCNRSRWTPK